MKSVYEEMADLMVSTLTGSSVGVSRDEFVAMFKAKYPNEADFRAFVDEMKSQASQITTFRFSAGAEHVHAAAPAKTPGSWLH